MDNVKSWNEKILPINFYTLGHLLPTEISIAEKKQMESATEVLRKVAIQYYLSHSSLGIAPSNKNTGDMQDVWPGVKYM